MSGAAIPTLFNDPQMARAMLDCPGGRFLQALSVCDEMWLEWERFHPFADDNFVREINHAIRGIAASGSDMEARVSALTRFHRRWWEMAVGCDLLDRGFRLVPYSKRLGDAGPDLLIAGERSVWVECVVPDSGIGPDRVPNNPCDGEARDVPDSQATLRLLGAMKEKAETKWPAWISKRVVRDEDAFVVAINGRFVGDGPVPDDDPPRIVRGLLGLGPLAVQFEIGTGKHSDPFLTTKREIGKLSGQAVATTKFRDPKWSHVSAVLYSTIDVYNRPRPPEAHRPIWVQNPTAESALPANWFTRCTRYTLGTTDQGESIRRTVDP